MARLRTLASDGAGSEITLRPGQNRFGRADDNDFQLLDPAVSGHHCVIEYNEGVAIVRDLGSTNGTFVNGVPVQEAILQNGQVLRLGTVELLYEEWTPEQPSEQPAHGKGRPTQPIRIAPPLQPAPPPIALSTQQTDHVRSCSRHVGVPAQWVCVKCHNPFCASCVKVTRAGMRDFYSCPVCGASCMTEHEFRRRVIMAQANFFTLLPEAFSYPLTKGGLTLLLVATVFLGFFEIARAVLGHFQGSFVFIYLWVAYWLSLIMILGFVFAFMQNVIVSSAHGEDKMPELPELSGFWSGIFVPFLRLVVIWAACLAPGFVMQFVLSPMVAVPFYLLGLACIPMAILTVSLADSIRGLNPVVVFSGIAKLPLQYFVTCIVFAAAIAARTLSELLLGLMPIPVLPVIVGTFIGLYGLTVGSRLLGLLYSHFLSCFLLQVLD